MTSSPVTDALTSHFNTHIGIEMTASGPEQNRDTRFLTSLRGFSALAVFLIHSGGGGLRQLGPYFNNLVDFSKFGVASFFVISAFSLALSVSSSVHFKFKHYMARRFLRIAPMYYLTMLALFLLAKTSFETAIIKEGGISLHELLMHLSFLNLFDLSTINSIIGIEWTVPIEMWAYLLLPWVCFVMMRASLGQAAVLTGALLLLRIAVEKYHPSLYHSADTSLSAYWSLEFWGYAFGLGIFAFKLCHHSALKGWDAYGKRIWVTALVASAIGIALVKHDSRRPDIWVTTAVTILIVGLWFDSRSKSKSLLFENGVLLKLGEYCFSFYLLHRIVITFTSTYVANLPLLFATSLVLTYGASAVCYRFIEKPAIALGTRKFKSKATQLRPARPG